MAITLSKVTIGFKMVVYVRFTVISIGAAYIKWWAKKSGPPLFDDGSGVFR
jgi:hypothetical protein